MPPRPSLLLRSIARSSPPWTCQSCRRPPLRTSQVSFFHATAPRFADSPPNHYETLQLTSSASPADIKRQFYALSKQHHPDRNPEDPTASTRFVAISEAYHVLSVPEKRAQYDAQLHQSERRGVGWGKSDGYPQGSYSSAAYGSRPASGLNKKRSTFRGPPPSFYKSGGYGEHGAKRAEYAYHNPHAKGKSQETPNESYGDFGGGFGPGQQKQGNQVPHFNDRKHKETHDNINQHIFSRRRRTARSAATENEYQREDMLVNFMMVSGVIGLIGMTAKYFNDKNEASHHAVKARS
ncbi:DnaJ-domain-containing protein [Setomelanomma holmii]|uniref:DnaJ-domain-containing protein n=1 Tax=Setomelanomma holmii TaxID=210430 RepID=A0A9P4HJQ6_9PLEO|nr:DnaJ-domain-containing protein [Setomelanomma holmii]